MREIDPTPAPAPSLEASSSRDIVIVSGLPRSGTSMIMGMLAAGGLELMTHDARGAPLDSPTGYDEFERMMSLVDDSAWISAARGKALRVVSFLLHYIPETYPAKLLFIRRDLREVLASQRTMLQRRGDSIDDETDDEIVRIFHRHLRRIAIEVRGRPNWHALYLNHRHVIEQPRAAADQVNRFLGERLDAEKMAAVIDPRLYHCRAG